MESERLDAILDKWTTITDNWRNGNLKDAARAIRELTKAELVFIFVEDRMEEYLVSNYGNRIQFQNFIEDSINGES